MRVLKELAKELTTPLAIIYNKCIDKDTLPSQWKEAIVTQIFKKGCKTDPSNFRPVSLTSVVCKKSWKELYQKAYWNMERAIPFSSIYNCQPKVAHLDVYRVIQTININFTYIQRSFIM